MSILDNRNHYRPFDHPWAYEAWEKQQQIHWFAKEVPMADDKRDWDTKLSPEEKYLLTQIFRFFTQADIDVASAYRNIFLPQFNKPELTMMLASFANMEGVHIDAYSQLIETVGMPESEYKAFLEYEEMVAKHDYVQNFEYDAHLGVGWRYNPATDAHDTRDERGLEALAKCIAVFSAFTEGLQLFSSFAILLNFTRFGKMKGMGTIITWSIRDETLHVNSMIRVFREVINEYPEIWTDDFKKELYDICRKMVDLEDKFIDLAFGVGGIEGLEKEEVKLYVRYIADRRLLQLGLKANYLIADNPLPWIDDIINSVEHVNFFEGRVTEYSKGTLKGEWDDVWNQKRIQ